MGNRAHASSQGSVRNTTRRDLKTLMEAAILYGMVIRAILIIHAALDGDRIIDIRHNPSRQSPSHPGALFCASASLGLDRMPIHPALSSCHA